MNQTRNKRVVRLVVLLIALGFLPIAKASDKPSLPLQCWSIDVPEGNKVSFHTYARGVQIYRWNGTSWDFVAPVATLYAEPKFFGEVGVHYMGPKWHSMSGSVVEGRRVPNTGCTPDASAIDWLLLSKFETRGSGMFAKVTYIQRVNTTGGLAPATPGLTPGETREVPYTAEYYFYRAHH